LQLFTATLRGWVHPADAFILLHKDDSNSFWLDREFHPSERFSVIGASTHRIKDADLGEIRKKLSNISSIEDGDVQVPFNWRPGLVGLLNYEGDYEFLEVDRAMVFDHANRRMYFLGYFDSKANFERWHHAALLRIGLTGGQVAQYVHERSGHAVPEAAQLLHSPEEYLRMIAQAQSHIAAGDVYQLCLTNQIQMQHEIDPLVSFLQLRRLNPAPYSTYLRLGATAIVCASPEQFLSVSKAGQISTKPIKGTRPRQEDEAADALVARELAENLKERAENLMIVDLMRNDFSQVAKPDSVSVESLFQVESYATVHQLVSTVTAELADQKTAVDALEAAFPGGSMTGAPKQRAMQLIRNLERADRGAYSGVIGYFGYDGSAEFGMTIRTMVFEKLQDQHQVSIGIGGGITIDSDPQAELAETELKALALLKVLGVASPWA
jgi:para-aminobenzoate synthetase component 1